ncbi:MAG: Ribosome-recycling factor [candidate division CPR1 bacterium GW2011_GWC1_49_13]|uniref:Ribosome-recycling factor n=1 Tax=candidate division CPR1 bacterium GW2011_GWC1_49_13 TaxID=1618342 RepID=A0A0G1VGK7_9BACT|nr:MAG: Ribosome-recycling factor [candidate division CPR1 bacterium GW2011_GWC1_49_13]
MDLDSQLSQITQKLKEELAKVRTGRATSALVEDLKVEVYGGSVMSLKELASIAVPEPRQLLITPWDKSVLPDVEKGLRAAGFNPTAGDQSLRLVFPPLTGEERERLIKELGFKAEEARIAGRVVRKDLLVNLERAKTAKEISEDDYFSQKKQIDEKMEEFNKEIEVTLQDKRTAIEL